MSWLAQDTNRTLCLFFRGLDVADMRKAIAWIVPTFPGSPHVSVVRGFDVLPEVVKQEAQRQDMGESFPGVPHKSSCMRSWAHYFL